MISRALLIAAAMLFAAAPSHVAAQNRWNPAAPENRQVLGSFSYRTVEPVLAQIGARWQRRPGGQPALAVVFPNGRQAGLVMGSCTSNGSICRSLSIQSIWPRPADPARLDEGVQRFNQRYAFSRAFVLADGRPAVQRYLTADYGIIRGNLAVNLLVFADQADRFAAEVLQAPTRAR